MKITIDDLKIKVDIPMQLYYDNKSTMSIVHNLVNMIGPNTLKLIDTSPKVILKDA